MGNEEVTGIISGNFGSTRECSGPKQRGTGEDAELGAGRPPAQSLLEGPSSWEAQGDHAWLRGAEGGGDGGGAGGDGDDDK